ncbi:MAG: hypothetical protein ABSD98_16810 [Candidatus Korobacteraceae bacterium]|jgi:hypothetical protein
MRHWLIPIALCGAFALAQEPVSPSFRDAALEALDSVIRVPWKTPISEAEMVPRQLDAEKALTAVHRKAATSADKNVYELLDAALNSKMYRIEYEHMVALSECKSSYVDMPAVRDERTGQIVGHGMSGAQQLQICRAGYQVWLGRLHAAEDSMTQCILESKVALRDMLDELTPEQLETARKQTCLSSWHTVQDNQRQMEEELRRFSTPRPQ